MSFKKTFRIISVNLFITLVLYIAAEICFYIDYRHQIGCKIFEKNNYQDYITERFTNPDIKTVSDKRPVLLIGCSYTYGQCLEADENLSFKITALSGKPVYNIGVIGHGPNLGLFLLQEQEKYNFIKEKPDLIIYTYMFNHFERWSNNHSFTNALRKAGIIPNQKYNFLYRSYIYQYFQNRKLEDYYKSFERKLTLLIDTIKAMKEQCDKLFPESKFVVLLYSDVNKDLCEWLLDAGEASINEQFEVLYSDDFRKNLKKIGITVISTEELIGRKMDREEDRVPSSKDPNHPHPSASAWDEIVPVLVKRLNL